MFHISLVLLVLKLFFKLNVIECRHNANSGAELNTNVANVSYNQYYVKYNNNNIDVDGLDSLFEDLFPDVDIFSINITKPSLQNNISTNERRDCFDRVLNSSTTNLVDIFENCNEMSISKARPLSGTKEVSSTNDMKIFMALYPIKVWRSDGYFKDDLLDIINPHWLQFPPQPESYHRALGSFYILFVAVGVVGNLCVLFMFARCRSLRTPANILVANLAISDFLMMSKIPIFIYNSFHLGPALGKTGCIVYGFIGGLTGTVDITTLSAIAFDRYSVVVNPLDSLKSLNNMRAKVLVVSTWMYGCVFAIIPALDFGFGRYSPEGFLTSCSFDYLLKDLKPQIFILVFFVAAWLLPFIIISFCYIRILIVVMTTASSSKVSERTLSTRHIKEEVKRKAELKLSALVIVVIALFFVSWTPHALVSLVAIFGRPDLVTPIVSMVPAIFCKTASCINPFIYIMTHPKFRKEFEQMFCRGALHKPNVLISGGSGGTKDRPEREPTSESDVEILEIRNISFPNTDNSEPLKRTQLPTSPIRAVSSHLHTLPSGRQGADIPPSWIFRWRSMENMK